MAKKSVCEFEPLKETERRQRFCPVEWKIKQEYSPLSSRVLAFFKNNRKKRKLANHEYQNCGQLARMISTQLCDKQLFLGLDTFETFRKTTN